MPSQAPRSSAVPGFLTLLRLRPAPAAPLFLKLGGGSGGFLHEGLEHVRVLCASTALEFTFRTPISDNGVVL